MTFLWDGSDGDEPSLTLDEVDIDLLLHLLDEYRETKVIEAGHWPNEDDLSRVGGWLARWKAAQFAWEEREERQGHPGAPAEVPPEHPF